MSNENIDIEEQSQKREDNNEGQEQVLPQNEEVNNNQEQEQIQTQNVVVNVNQEDNIDMEEQS